MNIIGLDLSLDHGGIVVLDDHGSVIDAGFISIVKKYATVDDRAIILSKKGKDETKETFRMRRLEEYWEAMLSTIQSLGEAVDRKAGTVECCLEGYAFHATSTGILQIAELTGAVKHGLWKADVGVRIHDPLSVKMFATGMGNATKKDVVTYARRHMDIPDELLKTVKRKKRGAQIIDYDGPGTDMADAYALAKMLWTEREVKAGRISLASLPEGQRKLFLRVTKSNPVNLLDRPMEL